MKDTMEKGIEKGNKKNRTRKERNKIKKEGI